MAKKTNKKLSVGYSNQLSLILKKEHPSIKMERLNKQSIEAFEEYKKAFEKMQEADIKANEYILKYSDEMDKRKADYTNLKNFVNSEHDVMHYEFSAFNEIVLSNTVINENGH
ncbi:MAG: hypothetical protein JNL70_25820 [Saprospiraceae bacterium]|nr:hypothetical protein [Saprospiraceae bacterium]